MGLAGLARFRFVGPWNLNQQREVTAAANNLLKMARLGSFL